MITRTVLFIGALTLAGTAQAALQDKKSVGVSKIEAGVGKEEKPAAPQTNFVLMCQEIEYTDFLSY